MNGKNLTTSSSSNSLPPVKGNRVLKPESAEGVWPHATGPEAATVDRPTPATEQAQDQIPLLQTVRSRFAHFEKRPDLVPSDAWFP